MSDEELDQLLDNWDVPEAAPSLRRRLGAAFPADVRRRLWGVPVRWIVAFAVSAGVVAVGTGLVGEGKLNSFWGSAELPGSTVYVQITQMVDPPLAGLKWGWKGNVASVGSSAGAARGMNALHDRPAKLFYGFEYQAEPVAGGSYRVTFSPLQTSDIQSRVFVVTAGIAPLPQIPAPQVVADGQALDVDLYRSGSERVFSRLEFSAKPFHRVPQPPREQQPQMLTMEDPKLYKNGRQVASDDGGWSSGATLWFRLAGLGRFLIALDPAQNPAFVKAGTLKGNALEFQMGGDQYRIECSKPMATGATRDIYVYHDLEFESQVKPEIRDTMFGSAGPACVFNGVCGPH
jgi:hypothetical protein